MIKIVYWSGTGNTEEMAKYISQGIKEEGKEVEIKHVGDAEIRDAVDSEILILGCPAMGGEELEESEMAPFVESLKEFISGHKVVLFGSYGWGAGEWMTSWEQQMMEYKAELSLSSLIINEFTASEDERKCIEFGKKIAQI